MTEVFRGSVSIGDLVAAMEASEKGRRLAIGRLQRALDIAFESNRLDVEEIDHLNEIMRMLKDSKGVIHWGDILNFTGQKP